MALSFDATRELTYRNTLTVRQESVNKQKAKAPGKVSYRIRGQKMRDNVYWYSDSLCTALMARRSTGESRVERTVSPIAFRKKGKLSEQEV